MYVHHTCPYVQGGGEERTTNLFIIVRPNEIRQNTFRFVLKSTVEMVIRDYLMLYKISIVISHLPRENCLFLQSLLFLLNVNYPIMPQKLVYRAVVSLILHLIYRNRCSMHARDRGICPAFSRLPPTAPLTALHTVATSTLQTAQHRIRQHATNFLTFDRHFAKKQV